MRKKTWKIIIISAVSWSIVTKFCYIFASDWDSQTNIINLGVFPLKKCGTKNKTTREFEQLRNLIATISVLERDSLPTIGKRRIYMRSNLVNFGPQTVKNRTVVLAHPESIFSDGHSYLPVGAKGRCPLKISPLVKDNQCLLIQSGMDLHAAFSRN